MKIKFKFQPVLLLGAFLFMTTSCGPKESGRETSEGENTEYESTERGHKSSVPTLKDMFKSKSPSAEASESTSESSESSSESTEAVSSSSESTSDSSDFFADKEVAKTGVWDPSTDMYTDDSRHFFWDLSFYKDWNTFSNLKLPKGLLFAGESESQVMATIMIVPLNKSKDITSIWEIPKDIVLNRLMVIQDKAFPKTTKQTPVVDKVEFRNKGAYKISYTADVPDHRNNEKKVRFYKIQQVAMVSDNEIIAIEVMAPQPVLNRFGDDIFHFLIGKFNFVD